MPADARAYFPYTYEQYLKAAKHPKISAEFALAKGLWDGRKVAVLCITRGNAHTRTTRRFYYGTLDLTAGDANQIGVVGRDGTVSILHKNRAVDVYDMTRDKPEGK